MAVRQEKCIWEDKMYYGPSVGCGPTLLSNFTVINKQNRSERNRGKYAQTCFWMWSIFSLHNSAPYTRLIRSLSSHQPVCLKKPWVKICVSGAFPHGILGIHSVCANSLVRAQGDILVQSAVEPEMGSLMSWQSDCKRHRHFLMS